MTDIHRTRHTITVDAPARTVYDLIAHATDWPRVFPPTVHVERTDDGDSPDSGASAELITIWATANDEVKKWTSRRELDPEALTVGFRQRVSQPPVASMGGDWRIEPLTDASCTVVLDHDFTAVDDAPENLAWIGQAVDRNSGTELARLKASAEQAGRLGELLLTFTDTVTAQGSAADVYEFIWRAEKWQERLPHVARVALTEEAPGIQTLEMDTVATDGSQHTTRSVRVGFEPHRIVYKQLLVPALLTAHVGEWLLTETDAGLVIASKHTVVVKPEAAPKVLGPEATVADARAFLRKALGNNSLATMRHAKEFAEERGGVSVG
ncbi:aromatase/cyclase [Streptomyces sp. NPDC002680]|uniref:aromatase/cyclase n=1 Tax=Streptomyces sp. NPDC002680 TaxID=3364659 RepID=UPI0036B39A88